ESIIDILILASRYAFVLFIFIFLWSGYRAVFFEKEKDIGEFTDKIYGQRTMIILTHVLGFVILMMTSKDAEQIKEIMKLSAFGLLFIILFMIFTSLIYKKSDPIIWNSMLFLMVVGLIMLERIDHNLAQKQIIWFLAGSFLMILIPLVFKIIPRFEAFKYVYLIIGWIFIISPFILGKERYGAYNWIYIGDFAFQPSEIVKFLFIFYLASALRVYDSLKDLILPTLMAGGYVLVLVLQRDLGGALIFFLTFLIMVYVRTSSSLLFFAGLGGASLASMLAYKLFSHVRVRVQAWLNPWREIDTKGYQITQSLFAIGTWGWLGSGLTAGYPKHIPVVESDFIFSAICEEFGNLFSIGIILIFLFIILRGTMITLNCNRIFYSLLGMGAISLIAIQTFLIIGGVIKLIPLTGVTLPFVSYGGSSVVVSIMIMGILQWIQSFNETREEVAE
ncbi:MAG TPA: FtsW/RodA/SpoVE family cell cycle protein, partial [Defluviitaleaceae bacterium]|nr:FtsW/RodA/SpoVE family cell cycle protein [Defluviitaleaceae bacterium]